jgi:predicted nucleotidyltransferase
MKFGLEEADVIKIQSVFSLFPEVEKVILYGSRAKGNYRPSSDIDLTLIGDNLNFEIVSQIETKIDDLLLPYLFDISIFSQISNSDLVDHIERIGVIFFDN